MRRAGAQKKKADKMKLKCSKAKEVFEVNKPTRPVSVFESQWRCRGLFQDVEVLEPYIAFPHLLETKTSKTK